VVACHTKVLEEHALDHKRPETIDDSCATLEEQSGTLERIVAFIAATRGNGFHGIATNGLLKFCDCFSKRLITAVTWIFCFQRMPIGEHRHLHPAIVIATPLGSARVCLSQ
jgi:hypothetical protein